MTDAPELEQTDPNVCYRHPDRQSWVLCQRCGRTICPACQRPAAVGVHCPECVREAMNDAPRVHRAAPRPLRVVRAAAGSNRFGFVAAAPVTWSIVGVELLLFIIGFFTSAPADALVFAPEIFNPATEPWRMLTTVFVPSSSLPYGLISVALNVWVLAVLGPQLERSYGWWRFLVLYLLSAFGGSVAMLLILPSNPAYGPAGPIFGLFAALVWLRLRFGAGATSVIVVLAINLVLMFVTGGQYMWPMIVGGIVVGLGIGWVLVNYEGPKDRPKEIGVLIATTAVLIVLTIVGVWVHGDLFAPAPSDIAPVTGSFV